MTLRTSYILGLIACTTVGLTSVQLVESAQAETLKITGPNGELKQQVKRQYGPTTVKDTFWSIAQKVRPNDKVSVYQVMAALFDANPHAFSGNNYNTLERGMILLVPSADVMAAIPNNVAKRRAEQDDRRVSRATPPTQVISQPAQLPKITTPKKPTAGKPLQIVQKTPAVEVQTKVIKEANDVVVKELNSELDKANAKTLMLTDELARSQDELMVSNNDNQVLKNKIEQMSLNISSLEEDLQLLREKYEGLTLENENLAYQAENVETLVEEPTDFWRSLMDNTILLILAASIPLLMLFGFIFWLLSRRNKKTQQAEIKSEIQPEQQSTTSTVDDDAEDIVVHLDSDDEESIDDLLDLDSVDLQPEAQMSSDAEMDMASEMFISEKEIEDDEGTSLDDLWAEAMDDQDSELEPLEDDDDLDSLLDGLDDQPAATISSTAPEDDLDSLLADLDVDSKDDVDGIDASADDDIDSLLAEFDMPAESADTIVDEPVKADSSSAEDDIDSLLAEFDMPAESADTIVDEPVKADSSSAEDDIDSLLAEFDMPADSTDTVVDEPVKADSSSAEDDIDSLLAELDMPADSTDTVVDEPIKADSSSSEDDIDSLLAEFDMPAESAGTVVDEPATADEAVKVDNSNVDDDVDSLLAEFDMPAGYDEDIDDVLVGLTATNDDNADDTELTPVTSDSVDNDDDIAALIAAELQDDDVNDDKKDDESSDEDIDALLANLNEPVIESIFVKSSDHSSSDELQNTEDDIAAQIEAELNDEDAIDESDTSDEDIDALLADLNQPVVEPETNDSDRDSVQAQIAEELNDEDVAHAIDDNDTSDEDIDALLADLNQPVVEPETNDFDRDSVQAQIAAELNDEDVADTNDESDTSDEDIDVLLADLNQPVVEPETSDSDRDSVQAQIAAELNDEDVADTIDESDTSDEDIDALLADLNQPEIEPETSDSEQAQIAEDAADAIDVDDSDTSDEDIDALLADLNQTVVEPEVTAQDIVPQQDSIIAEPEEAPFAEESISDDDSLDDDMNTLLASFQEDDQAPSTSDPETVLGGDEPINDDELFAEFDEYLTDNNLTQKDDIEVVQDAEEIPETMAFEADDGLDALLSKMDDDTASPTDQQKTNKDSGFFNDLKSSKPKPELLDWESDLLNAAQYATEEQKIDEPEVSDDDLLAAFSQSLKDDNDDDFTSEDEYILSDDNLTVDEALAALDQNEQSQSVESKTTDDDLMRFERENGYIDIDKLLNDADENDDKTDQYKDVNIDMGSANSLMGNPDMVDVDDEENSVNAKLDLARAYIEIEDQDSARALLKEVQMDGNERQKLEAKSLLESFS
ncbi:FimV/HubP family polar landmark protein [Shewanella sp. H8]|uniref:FimV/HubP family polar landmark protein n=1 Tax=Shewanella sp. H8 TaxID=3342676 RepID=UPI0033156B1F